MRLTPNQIAAIRASANEVFGPSVDVWLFGSRVDDHKRGGDIDLLIRAADMQAHSLLVSKLRFLGLLEQRLGERKVDVVIEMEGDTRPIVRVAHETGVRL
jgi:uncharacterized protein